MLSLFPQLLFLSPFAALLIRIALAAYFAYEGWHGVTSPANTRRRIGGACALLVAVIFLVGAWTQLFALLSAVSLTISLFTPQDRTLPKSTVLLAIVMALSLLLTGPGPFAFDLPL